MTNEEKFKKWQENQEKKKEKERQKKKEEREKKRIRGYKKYLTRKHHEMEKKKREEEKKKEKERARKEKLKSMPKKRKPGRPKKRGPKKKRKYVSKKAIVVKPRPVFDYKLVYCENGRQVGYRGVYRTSEDAYEDVKNIIAESDSVLFRRKVLAGGKEALTELLLLEKNRNGDKENSVLRNEYGRLVEQKSNLTKWVIMDKWRINIEETIWVYGFNPKTERKTAQWFMERTILDNRKDKSDIKRVIYYLNKVIVKRDDGSMDMAICKDIHESYRLYNILYQTTVNEKIKNVWFLGDFSKLGPTRRKLEEELMEMTGWDLNQIRRRVTKK